MYTFNYNNTNRKRELEELPIELPKEEPPKYSFGLRPRLIQAGTEFKLICCVNATPVPKVTGLL